MDVSEMINGALCFFRVKECYLYDGWRHDFGYLNEFAAHLIRRRRHAHKIFKMRTHGCRATNPRAGESEFGRRHDVTSLLGNASFQNAPPPANREGKKKNLEQAEA